MNTTNKSSSLNRFERFRRYGDPSHVSRVDRLFGGIFGWIIAVVVGVFTAAACGSDTGQSLTNSRDAGVDAGVGDASGPDSEAPNGGDAGAPGNPDGPGVSPTADASPTPPDAQVVEGEGGTAPPNADAQADATRSEPLVTLEEYCTTVAQWYYPYLRRCYGASVYPESEAPDFILDSKRRCMLAASGVSGGRLSFDASKAAQCINLLAEVPCYVSLDFLPHCEDVFEGRASIGETCYLDETRYFAVAASECDEGLCVGETCPQKCFAYPAEGQPCVGARCGPDHFCDESTICRARKDTGAACDGDQCQLGLACIDTSDGSKCVRRVPLGSACEDDAPCNPPGICVEGICVQTVRPGDRCLGPLNCPDGYECNVGPGESLAACNAPAGDGDPCDVTQQCASGLYCDRSEPTSLGICRQVPEIDDPCANPDLCEDGAWCQHPEDASPALCRPLGSLGADCLSFGYPFQNGCKSGFYCGDDGTCARPGADEEPCSVFVAESCEAGLYCSRETTTCTAPSPLDEQCNPYWDNTCEAGLGCDCGLTEFAACATFAPTSTPTDTCQPLLERGAPCRRHQECSSGSCLAQSNGETRCFRSETEPCIGN